MDFARYNPQPPYAVHDKDVSGLTLAKAFPHVSKILLSGFPEAVTETIRNVLQQQGDTYLSLVDVISKIAPVDELVHTIHHAFAHHVDINFELHVTWGTNDPYDLAKTLWPDLEDDLIANRVTELEHSLKRLYAKSHAIELSRLVWQREQNCALLSKSYSSDGLPQSHLTVFKSIEVAPVSADHNSESHAAEEVMANTNMCRTTHIEASSFLLDDTNISDQLRTLEKFFLLSSKVEPHDGR